MASVRRRSKKGWHNALQWLLAYSAALLMFAGFDLSRLAHYQNVSKPVIAASSISLCVAFFALAYTLRIAFYCKQKIAEARSMPPKEVLKIGQSLGLILGAIFVLQAFGAIAENLKPGSDFQTVRLISTAGAVVFILIAAGFWLVGYVRGKL